MKLYAEEHGERSSLLPLTVPGYAISLFIEDAPRFNSMVASFLTE